MTTSNHLKKFIKYSKKVYKIEDSLKKLEDTRRNPSYSTAEVVTPVLLGFIMRIQSFNELKYRLKSNDFQPVINRKMKSPQIDTIRDTLKVVDTSGLMKMNQEIIRKSKRNEIFDKERIDGTKLFMTIESVF